MFELQIGDVRPRKLRQVALGSVSVTLHLLAFAAIWLALLTTSGNVVFTPQLPHVSLDFPRFVTAKSAPPGEIGSGDRNKLPVTQGDAAPPRARPFLLQVTNPEARLKIAVSSPLLDAPALDTGRYGDPYAEVGSPSLGPGGPLGRSPGPGSGGGGKSIGDTIYSPGHGVTTPILVLKVDPDYTDEARRVKRSGLVTLRIVVDAKGIPTQVSVVQPLGFGLDERAVEAVRRWRFRPGMKDGRPVAVEATVEVNFRLL